MRKSFRSVLWTGALLGAVAACGDDVTITPPAGGGVHSVTVAPDGANLTIGQTLQMIAAVNADSGIATTVTWSSSDAAKASVSATGLVTAVQAGSVAIRACSTVNSSVCGAATVTVTAAQPATISISAINAFATGLPVNINNVVGQINAVLNFEPGSTPATRIELLIDGVAVDSQSFSSLKWAELVQKAQEAAAKEGEELAEVVITLSVNTADFNTTTGAPRYPNGPRLISARAVLQGGTQTATPSQTLIFNNANTFTGTMVVSGTTSAPGQNAPAVGLTYRRGALSFTVLPVIYSPGLTMASGSVIFGGCSAGGARTATLTAPAAGAFAWTATMSNTATAGASNVTAYEFNAAACAAATVASGESFAVNATDNQGNTLFALVAPLATPPATPVAGIRLDNVGPGAGAVAGSPTFAANPNGRANGWINATVGLTGLNTSATDDDWLLNGTGDIGVGGYTRMLRIGTGGGDVSNANAATASATPALPASVPQVNAYCAVATATDALGNESGRPANATACLTPPAGPGPNATATSHLQFSVDTDAPTIAFSGGLAANARLNGATVGAEFQVTVTDGGTGGVSGMLAGAPVIGRVSSRSATATVCPFGPVGSLVSGVCVNSNVGFNYALPLANTTPIAASSTDSYLTFFGLGQDAAGNKTAELTRVVVFDNEPAAATAPAVPVTITGAFNAAAFLNDNLSIRDYYWRVVYTGLVAPIRLDQAVTAVDAFNSATLTNTNVAINKNVNTYLGLQVAPGAYVPNAIPLSSLDLFVRDQTQAAYTGPASAAIAPTAPATGVSNANLTSYADATSQATICAGQSGAPACGATPAGANWTFTLSGTTGVFNNPFSRVDVYARNTAAVPSEFFFIGSIASAVTNDNGAVRTHTYTMAVTALDLYTRFGLTVPAVLNLQFFGAGVNAAGDVAMINGGAGQTVNP